MQILATSREPLRIEGEHVHRLSQLESPCALAGLTAAEALVFPAIQLFVESTAAHLGEFEIEDADAPIVAEICQRLDRIPLFIEFAAARVAAIGLRAVAAHLGDCLRSLTCSHRTSLPRQQSFRGTLEWSYGLLSEGEKSTLQRLSVFAGRFSLHAAARVAADTDHSESETIDIVLELVAKSMIVVEIKGVEPHLRLFETTRIFARMKLGESGNADKVYRRHAAYYRDLLDSLGEESGEASHWASCHAEELDDIRAALTWAVSASGDRDRLFVEGFERSICSRHGCIYRKLRPASSRCRRREACLFGEPNRR